MTAETGVAKQIEAIDEEGENFEKIPANAPNAQAEKLPEAAMESIRRETADFLQSERERVLQKAQSAESEILDPEKRADVIKADKEITMAQEQLGQLAAAIDQKDYAIAQEYLNHRQEELSGQLKIQKQSEESVLTEIKEYDPARLNSELGDIKSKQSMDIYTDIVGEQDRADDEKRKAELTKMLSDIDRYNKDTAVIADRLNRAQEIEDQMQSETNASKRIELGFEAQDLRTRAQAVKDMFKNPDYNKYGEMANRVAEIQSSITELQSSIDAVNKAVEGVESAITDEQIKRVA